MLTIGPMSLIFADLFSQNRGNSLWGLLIIRSETILMLLAKEESIDIVGMWDQRSCVQSRFANICNAANIKCYCSELNLAMGSNSYLVRGDRCSNSSEDNSKDSRRGKNTPSCNEWRNLAGRFQGVQKSTQWWSVSRGPSISLLFTLRAFNQHVERFWNTPR